MKSGRGDEASSVGEIIVRTELTYITENMVKCFLLIKLRLKITAVWWYAVPRTCKVPQHRSINDALYQFDHSGRV